MLAKSEKASGFFNKISFVFERVSELIDVCYNGL